MKKGNKFGAKKTRIDGITFDSLLEAAYYLVLLHYQKIGQVKYFHMQVPILLPGPVRYIVDYQVFHNDGSVEYIDVKGVITDVFRIKKKQVEALYPIRIITVTKKAVDESFINTARDLAAFQLAAKKERVDA